MNVEAPLRLARAAWHGWMREHGGSVVDICTEGAGHVGPNVGAYDTSKEALLHLTEQPAGELAPRVRVNSVSPGLVRTEMARFVWEKGPVELPLGRTGEPGDVARAVVWPASDAAMGCPRASAVRAWGRITGADLLVDGGTRVRAAHPGGYAVHDRLRSGAPPHS